MGCFSDSVRQKSAKGIGKCDISPFGLSFFCATLQAEFLRNFPLHFSSFLSSRAFIFHKWYFYRGEGPIITNSRRKSSPRLPQISSGSSRKLFLGRHPEFPVSLPLPLRLLHGSRKVHPALMKLSQMESAVIVNGIDNAKSLNSKKH